MREQSHYSSKTFFSCQADFFWQDRLKEECQLHCTVRVCACTCVCVNTCTFENAVFYKHALVMQ